MRIAFVVGEFPALSETFVLNQITGLIERGNSVDIYAERPGAEQSMHPDVDRYGLAHRTRYEQMPPPLLRVMPALRHLLSTRGGARRVLLRALNLRRYGMQAASLRLFYNALAFLPAQTYDVIHAHFGPNGVKAAHARQLGAVRGALVTTFHGGDISVYPRQHGDRVHDQLFAEGDLFMPVSARWNDRLIAMGCLAGKIVVHRMGVDCSTSAASARLARQGGPLRVITVARLVEMKGIEFGIRAAARAAQSGLAVDYAIAGDGVLRQDLERLACALGVSESVHFLGALDGAQVARALCEADLFLCPSIVDSDGLEEGVPVAVMEAMAAGLPIVGSCLDGIAELVADGVTGFLTPPRDVGAIATRLEELIAHPALLVDMGERGRERVRREFDIERLNDRLVELYSQVANTYTLAERMRHASVL